MKRFWKDVETVADGDGWGVTLDAKPLCTPARKGLVVPAAAVADAIAGEWRAAGEEVDPRAMVLTGLANAAIDQIAPDRSGFAHGLARYAEADLACYRAKGPRPLVEWQAREWNGLLGWARRRFDVDFAITEGVIHVAQPKATVERLAHEVNTLDAFRLAGLSPLVTIGGSLIAGLAVLEKALTPDEGWAAVSVDEAWQIEQWGADAEAEVAMAARRRDFLAAARFLELLDG